MGIQRPKTGLHICFTLDAGANVHVLFPESEAKQIQEFIKTELAVHCQNGHFIEDIVGSRCTTNKNLMYI